VPRSNFRNEGGGFQTCWSKTTFFFFLNLGILREPSRFLFPQTLFSRGPLPAPSTRKTNGRNECEPRAGKPRALSKQVLKHNTHRQRARNTTESARAHAKNKLELPRLRANLIYIAKAVHTRAEERTVVAGGGGGAGITTPVSSEQSAFCGRSTKHSAQERKTKHEREKERESLSESAEQSIPSMVHANVNVCTGDRCILCCSLVMNQTLCSKRPNKIEKRGGCLRVACQRN
jgi:hypothetical protein